MKKDSLHNLSREFTNNYAMQTETLEGVNSIVVPVTMMVEGVHNGSLGPLLYTQAELTQSASSWNGFPVVVNHPVDSTDGRFISASEVDSDQIVGTIFNSHMKGKKLKASLRINPTNLKNVSSDTLQAIQNNRPLEVSIGAVSDNEEVEGEFNNESYIAIAHNLRPDHLALLPNDRGACSIDDGCGLRNSKLNNSKTKTNNDVVEKSKLTVKEMHGHLLANGYVIKELTSDGLTLNEMGFNEISMGIQQKLDSFDGESKYHYLQEVFPNNSFVYTIRNRTENTSKLYRRSYQVNDGQIALLDDAVEVLREVTYKVVTTVNRVRTKELNKNQKIMTKKVSTCQVDALIANKASKFGEDDREFLEGLDEPTFNKMLPEEKKEEKVIDNSSKGKEPVVNQEEITANAVKSFFASQKSPEAFIDLMPGALKDQMKEGLKLRNNRRKSLIDGIVANSEFTKEELEKWDNGPLETMHKSVVSEEVANDYSLNGENLLDNQEEESSEELDVMLNLNKTEEK